METTIELQEEEPIAVRELDATVQLALQDAQLCLSAAFSASSRSFGLNGRTSTLRRKMSSPIITE